jgi:hypothetical protein
MLTAIAHFDDSQSQRPGKRQRDLRELVRALALMLDDLDVDGE